MMKEENEEWYHHSRNWVPLLLKLKRKFRNLCNPFRLLLHKMDKLSKLWFQRRIVNKSSNYTGFAYHEPGNMLSALHAVILFVLPAALTDMGKWGLESLSNFPKFTQQVSRLYAEIWWSLELSLLIIMHTDILLYTCVNMYVFTHILNKDEGLLNIPQIIYRRL